MTHFRYGAICVFLVASLNAQVEQATVTSAATLSCEIDDVRSWAALSLYMAEKVRAGVALATARATPNPAEREKAIALLERAAGHWDELIRITDAHLQPVPIMHLTTRYVVMENWPKFFWKNYWEDVR